MCEPIKNLTKYTHNFEVNFMYEKFNELNKVLFESSNNFVRMRNLNYQKKDT